MSELLNLFFFFLLNTLIYYLSGHLTCNKYSMSFHQDVNGTKNAINIGKEVKPDLQEFIVLWRR